uniref:PDZ domain-containing protein n=1 Tax=Timema monikensis TaxID=170555 RepID=A0A7R9EB69_9NEOP|nr:unnamed protein product [Timema monikensis]
MHGGKVENPLGKTSLSTPDRDLNLEPPVIGSLVYCESSSIDCAATEAGRKKLKYIIFNGVRRTMDALLALDTLTSPTKSLPPPSSLSPPPSFSRLPPDGHEFPPNYQEPNNHFSVGIPAIIEMDLSLDKTTVSSNGTPLLMKVKKDASPPPPPLPTSGPPPRKLSARQDPIDFLQTSPERKFSTNSTSSGTDDTPITVRTTSSRVANWRKDEKSEKSVRDKIAMFSSVQDEPLVPEVLYPTLPKRLSKHTSSDNVFYQGEDSFDSSNKIISRSALSVDKAGQHSTSYRNSSPASSQPSSLFGIKSPAVYNSMSDVSAMSPHPVIEHNEPPRSLDFASRTQSSMDLTSSSSSAYSSAGSPDSSLSSTTSYSLGYSSTLPRKLNTNRQPQQLKPEVKLPDTNQKLNNGVSRANSFSVSNNTLHTRSQSLVDIGSIPSYTSKRNSIGQVSGYSKQNNSEDMRRASLNALIEQRRRGISKLRGLVIPEKVTEVAMSQPIIDLPEIKSRDSILVSKPPVVSSNNDVRPYSRQTISTNRWTTNTDSFVPQDKTSTSSLIGSPPWKSQSSAANLPKYSPAFKRKSLTLYGVPSSTSSVSSSLSSSREELRPIFDGGINNNNQKLSPPLPPSKPPRHSTGSFPSNYNIPFLLPEPPKSLESITSPTRSDLSFEYVSSCGSSPDLRVTAPTNVKEDVVVPVTIRNGRPTNGDYYTNGSKPNRLSPTSKNNLSDTGRSGEDDSDNDSAVSSSRSSISREYSPPTSPLPDSQNRSDDCQHPLLANLPSSGVAGEKRPLRRTLSSETTASVASSTTSTLTSGSQASCSSNGSSSDSNKRVLKAQSVEAINRKNVLSSARYSSGKDFKIGSPLIQRKFDEDNDGNVNIIKKQEPSKLSLVENNASDYLQYDKDSPIDHISDHNIDTSTHKDAIHYRNLSLDETPNAMTNVIYFEVQEPESLEGAFDSSMLIASEKEHTANTYSMITPVVEHEELIQVKSVPLPAPRRSNIPTPVKISNGITVEESPITGDRWTELAKKYAKSTGDEGDKKVSKLRRQSSDDVTDLPRYETKEFTLDLKNKSLKIDTKPEESKSSQDKFSEITNTKNDDSFVGKKSEVPPSVPPKPQQRKSSNAGSDKVESPHAENNKELLEADLMTILTGKASKDPNIAMQLRERRRSKDSGNQRPSMSIERSASSEVILPHSGEKMSKTGERLQEVISPSATSRIPTVASRNVANRRSVSVNDIRKAFEKAELALANTGRAGGGSKTSSVITSSNGMANHHARVSSLDSTTSDDSFAPIPGVYGSVSSLQKEQFGSVTSIASSTSLISQQELQSLIDEANQVLEENGGYSTPVYEVLVIVLHRETTGGSIGITLAGGADYEAKEITVHKVLTGSPADKDGRFQKGDRILSINGRSMKGVTHREALNILKAPRTEVVLVVSRTRPDYDGAPLSIDDFPLPSVKSSLGSTRPPRIPEQPLDGSTNSSIDESDSKVLRGPPTLVTLVKDGAGLGFSLEGGRDSPLGDKPLTIKKIFTGGSAEKNGSLHAGDELLNVNGTDVTAMSRIEAWSLMKRLLDGTVSLTVRHNVAN